MLESWLATISTLLAVMGMLVELSSPDRQLKIALVTIEVILYQSRDKNSPEIVLKRDPSPRTEHALVLGFGEGPYIIWVSCKLLVSVEVGLVD